MKALLPLLLLVLAACGGAEPPPQGPLSRDRFERVLLRSLLIEARTGRGITLDHAMPDVQDEYDRMFSEEQVTRADFDSTYKAYLRRPEVLKAVYEKVLNDLQQQTDSVPRSAP